MGDMGRGHILVVEDGVNMAKVLKARLEHMGYQVHVERRGKAGLAYAVSHRPDLVLLDLMLPDMSGEIVCRALRNIYDPWGISVLILTGKDKPIDEVRGFAWGADAYMTKPYEKHELMDTIGLLMQQRQANGSALMDRTGTEHRTRGWFVVNGQGGRG